MKCLKAEAIDVVFRSPGAANLPTDDAFYGGGIRQILVRHDVRGGDGDGPRQLFGMYRDVGMYQDVSDEGSDAGVAR